ncbi:MAG: hypothetical protein KIT48_09390 [Pseudolabrys sp.]|jgi:LacI family gluconate utilization system Gnt-I transcriptional repressor|nr:hypothetical protein [Pseudolabrys sp.]
MRPPRLQGSRPLSYRWLGDYEIASENSTGLTTLQSHAYELGHEAMNMTIKRGAETKPRSKMIDTGFQIVKRASA